jgi:hypothetical protein
VCPGGLLREGHGQAREHGGGGHLGRGDCVGASLCVYICMCMCVCMYVCSYVCTFVCMCDGHRAWEDCMGS